MSGFDLIEKLQTDLGRYDLPIIVYTGKELTRKEELHLKKVADAIIVKEASSPERLLAETALVPASRGSESAGAEAAHAGEVSSQRSGAGRPQGAGS